jgi:hypothetical protein
MESEAHRQGFCHHPESSGTLAETPLQPERS